MATLFGAFDPPLGEDGALLAKIGAFSVIFIIVPAKLFGWWLECKGATLTITTQRIVVRKGILSKKTNEVRHADVRFVRVEQGILQRILGVGAIAVGSAGHAGVEVEFGGLSRPQRIAAMIRERQAL